MRARWIERWGGELRRGQRPHPEPAEGELLLRVEACGVGLTVLNCIRGDLGHDPANLPRIPGHEIVGRVTATGVGVSADWVGARVAVFFYLYCGDCRHCIVDNAPLCERLRGFMGVDRDGGYAEHAVVPVRNAVRLPEAVDPVLATAVPDAIATPIHVARLCKLTPGDRACVIGAGGGVGIHMVQVAQLYGARVLGVESSARKRAVLASELGLEALDSSNIESTRLPASWNGTADVVIDLLGSEASMLWAINSLDRGGRLVLLTTFEGVRFPLSARDVVLSGLTIYGSRYAGVQEVQLAAELVATGRVRPIVSEVTDLDDVDRIHGLLRSGELIGRGAIFNP